MITTSDVLCGIIILLILLIDLIVLELGRIVLFPGLLQWEQDLLKYGRQKILCVHYLDASGKRRDCKLAKFRLWKVQGCPGRKYWYAGIQYQEHPGRQIWMVKYILYCDGRPQWDSVINGGQTMTDRVGRVAPYHHPEIGGFHRLGHFLQIASGYVDMDAFANSGSA